MKLLKYSKFDVKHAVEIDDISHRFDRHIANTLAAILENYFAAFACIKLDIGTWYVSVRSQISGLYH